MESITFFKLQAKNLLRDYKTQFFNTEENVYDYKPKYFDVNQIVIDFCIDEEDKFSLMKAQHIIAVMVGFKKWSDLINVTRPEFELAKLLFDNQDKTNVDEWKMYISRVGYENKTYFEPETQLEIFKHVFLNGEHISPTHDYRLKGNCPANNRRKRKGEPSDTEVDCLHCGQSFPLNKPKHAPGCDGQAWDLIPV